MKEAGDEVTDIPKSKRIALFIQGKLTSACSGDCGQHREAIFVFARAILGDKADDAKKGPFLPSST